MLNIGQLTRLSVSPSFAGDLKTLFSFLYVELCIILTIDAALFILSTVKIMQLKRELNRDIFNEEDFPQQYDEFIEKKNRLKYMENIGILLLNFLNFDWMCPIIIHLFHKKSEHNCFGGS